MNRIRKLSVVFMLVASLFMTGCDAGQIVEIIQQVSQGIQQAAPAIKEVIDTVKGIFGNNNNNNAAPADAPAPAPTPAQPETEADTSAAETVVIPPTDQEDIADTPTEEAQAPAPEPSPAPETAITTTASATANPTTTPVTTQAAVQVSADGKQQLSKVIDYALANNRGASNGECFNAVWGYLTSSGYGNLAQWNDLPEMQSAEARHFAEYMNSSQASLDKAGLQRLDTSFNPPITSPHDPRIPAGAVIVVGPGSTGTSHATAGDIVIKAGEGRFVNDGPNMDYGTADTWQGTLLGVYIPK